MRSSSGKAAAGTGDRGRRAGSVASRRRGRRRCGSASTGCRASTRPGPRQVRQGRRAQGRPEEGPERARPQPGHLGERAPTSCRWPRTWSRRAKGWQVWAVERRENLLEDHSVFNKAKAGTATPQRGVRLLPRLAHRHHHHGPLPVHPERRGRVRAQVGHARRGRGPAPRRQGGQAAGRQGRARAATRSAARSPPPTRPGTSRASPAPATSRAWCSSTAAAARRRSRPSRPTSRCRPWRRLRRRG